MPSQSALVHAAVSAPGAAPGSSGAVSKRTTADSAVAPAEFSAVTFA